MYIFISFDPQKNLPAALYKATPYSQRAVCNKSKIASIYRSGAYRERYNILPTQYSLIRTYGDLLSFMKSLKYEQELYSGTLPEIGRIPYYHLLQKNSLSPFLPFKDFENEGEF